MRNHTAKAAVLVAGALLLVGCSSNKNESGSSGSSGSNASCDQSKGTLTIGVIAPQSGGLSALGLGIKNSVDLAVKQANQKCTVKGYKLVVDTEDDEANPQKGAQGATKLATDANTVGVVGTLNSSVSQTVQPILAQKNIVQVSPANTNPTLTRGDDFAANPARKYPTYFRVCTTDNYQGPYAADYLVNKAGKKKIAVITDGKTYGVGLATEFKKQATKDGAAIAAEGQVGEKDTDFSGVIGNIKGAAPDAVYYGGEYPVAGPLSKQLKDAGLDIPVMGGDGIFDPQYIKLGGRDGDLATSVGAPTEKLDTAKAFVSDYNNAKYSDPYGAYGAFSYDAANAIIGSLAKTLGDNGTWGDDKRADLLKNVGSYSGKGATGDIAFDQYGDSTNKVLTVYQVSGGAWSPALTGTFGG